MDLNGITTNPVGFAIAAAIFLVMVAIVTGAAILLTRGIQDQIKYNKTVLPSLDLEADNVEGDEEQSAFDVDRVFEVDEEEGFESDEWFAKIREEKGLDNKLPEPTIKEDEEESGYDAMTSSQDNSQFNPYLDDEEVKPVKRTGLPQL